MLPTKDAEQATLLEVNLGSGDLYAAIIVYACDVDAPSSETLYQECYSLIRASSTDDAIEKVEAYAHRPLTPYKNGEGQTVTWRLETIVDVRSVLADATGADVIDLSVRHFRDYTAYRAFTSSETSSPKGR